MYTGVLGLPTPLWSPRWERTTCRLEVGKGGQIGGWYEDGLEVDMRITWRLA